MHFFARKEFFAIERICILVIHGHQGQVLVHQGCLQIYTETIDMVVVVQPVTPISVVGYTCTQLDHVPKHTYTDIHPHAQLLELVMVGIAMDELVVFAIDMCHDGVVTMAVIGVEAYIHLALVIVQAEAAIIDVIRYQVWVASFDLQRVGELVNGTELRERRIEGTNISVQGSTPLFVEGTAEAETRAESPSLKI